MMVLASMGVFVLGRRWIQAGPASLLSGALYGFGPALISLARSGPTLALLVAILPWLCCPAVYVHRWLEARPGPSRQTRWAGYLEAALYLAPFFLIIAILAILRKQALPYPIQLGPFDSLAWLAPCLAAKRGAILSGVYHIPTAALVIGLTMLMKARRWPVIIVFVAALTMATWPPLALGHPAVWLCLASMWAAVMAGVGTDGLIWAGWPDRRWISVGLLINACLAGCSLGWAFLLTKHDPAYPIDDLLYVFRMYGAGMAWLALVLAVVLVRERLIGLRQGLAIVAIGIDLVLSSRSIVDTLF